jgi:NADH-ubiquinone oxidoreductase chain 5
LSSYLLINFWFTRLAANKSAIKAVIVNRFGDFSLVIGLLVAYSVFRSFDYGVIFVISPVLVDYYFTFYIWEVHALSFLSLFLLLGCVGKSAQMGLHTWLPDAMEGPTPVSALIHAATMVTAGVFVLTRFSPVLELSPGVLGLVVLVGAFTAFFAGTVGIFQNDLKRVIAYSTCSQLGYMVLACGLSNYSLALFHLLNHAFFKALLFLSAGSVIHALVDEQDMRRMGGLLKLLPFTYTCFLIGSLALMGFPYTSGFYSKDFILETAYSSMFSSSLVSYTCGLMAALCTAFYSFRLIYLTFISESNIKRSFLGLVHEPDVRMTVPLFFLVFFSIFTGYLLKDAFIGIGTPFLASTLQDVNFRFEYSALRSEFIFASEKAVPVVLSLLSAAVACYLYSSFPLVLQVVSIEQGLALSRFFFFFNKKWYFDQVYNAFVVYPLLRAGHSYTFRTLDRGLVELVGPTGLVRFWLSTSVVFAKWQSGYIFTYVFSMVIALVGVLMLLRLYLFPVSLLAFSSVFCFSFILKAHEPRV